MKSHLKTFCLAALFSGSSLLTGCGEDLAKADDARGSEGISTNAPASAAGTQSPGLGAPGSGVSASTESRGSSTNEIVAVVAPKVPDDIKISRGVEKIIKMAQSGLGDSVLLAFIDTSTDAFELDADEILYLTDIGLSEEVLASMLKHDGASRELLNQAKEQPAAVAAMTPAPSAAPATDATVGYSSVPVNTGVALQEAPQPQPQPEYGQPQVIVSQPQTVVTYDTFYSSLSPYGTWLEVPAYGWCWQPTVAVVDVGWRPYDQRGRWLYSDCGWYWQSDYSWGWAPFHYGRWYRPEGRGWCWVPDRTWGPSWVSWRQGSGFYGWAPLPPAAHYRPGVGFSFHNAHVGASFGFGLGYDAYTFVPSSHFYDRSPHRHTVSRSESSGIYNHSTVVNNYVTGNNNTVINNGISPAHVASATRTEIHKVSIRDLPPGTTSVRPDRLRQQGNNLVVYRPSPEAVIRPSTLRPQTAEHAAVNRSSAFGAPAIAAPAARNEAVHSRPVVSGSTPRTMSPREAAVEQSTPDLRPRPMIRGSDPARNPTASSGVASRGQPSQVESPRSEPARSYTAPVQAPTATVNRPSAPTPDRVVGSITDQSGVQRPIQSRPNPLVRSSEPATATRPIENPNPQMSRGNPTWTGNSTVSPNVGSRSSEPARGSGPNTVSPIQSRPVPIQSPEIPARTFGRNEPTRAPETVAIAPQQESPRYTPPIQSRPVQQAPDYQPRYAQPSPAPSYTPPAPVVSRPNIQSRPYTPPPQPTYSAPQPTARAAPTPAPAPHPVSRAPAPAAPQANQPVQSRGRQVQQ